MIKKGMFRSRVKTCPSQISGDPISVSSHQSGASPLRRRFTYSEKRLSGDAAAIHKLQRNLKKFFTEDSTYSPKAEDEVFHYISFNEEFNEQTRDKPTGYAEKTLSSAKDDLPTFLQRRIPPSMRRVKSSKMNHGKENRPVMDITSLMAQSSSLRNAEVELPFFMPAIESPDVIDLSNCATEFKGALVRSLHQSILGKDHCFEIMLGETSRFFGCASAGEREAWIEKIKRAIDPTLDNSHRMEYQLTLFIQEAKGVTTKKKYFGEICLDRKLCAKTTSKSKNDCTLFWGEQFEFSSMPKIQDVTVHLYKDSDKKKKKDKDYMGLVNLPAASLTGQQTPEKWYTLSTPSGNNKTRTGEALALRIKANYMSVKVLPIDQYTALQEYISKNYLNICRTLGNHISVARKGEVARTLVHIMHGTGHMKEYMTDVVMDEVLKVEEESLIFRENTIGTKSVEAMLRLVGMKYLSDTLGDFVHALFNMEEECEVDGGRLPPQASLVANQNNLHMSCDVALGKITASASTLPSELREVMSSWRVKCEEAGRPRIANRLVTASLFLRLLCPAILNPSLFGLANEVPNKKVSRSLTLIAKVIQNLANRSRFGNKEEYMQFMDVFVREKWDDMGSFISNVCDPSIPHVRKGFEGFIDLGKEFAKLHAFFVEVLPGLDQKVVGKLGDLPSILNDISAASNEPTTTCASFTRDHVVEQSDAAQVAKNPQLLNCSDSEFSAHVTCCNSTPTIDERSFLSTAGASSLVDLRDFINAHEDAGDSNAPTSSLSQDFFPLRQSSNPALPITCSFNNSNNTDISWNKLAFTSTENMMSGVNYTPQSQKRSPLMVSQSAHRVLKQYYCTTHDLLCSNKAPVQQDSNDTNPTSSAHPVQASYHQQLKTVLTTEAMVYLTPTHHMAASSSVITSQDVQFFSELCYKPSLSLLSVVGTNNDISLRNSQSPPTSFNTKSCHSGSSSNACISNRDYIYRNNADISNTALGNTSLVITASYQFNTKASLVSPDHEPMEDDHLLLPALRPSTSLSQCSFKISNSRQSVFRGSPSVYQCDETFLATKTLVPVMTSPISKVRNTPPTKCSSGDGVQMTAKSGECSIYPRILPSQLSNKVFIAITASTKSIKRHIDNAISCEILKEQKKLFYSASVASSGGLILHWNEGKAKICTQRTACGSYKQYGASRSGAIVQIELFGNRANEEKRKRRKRKETVERDNRKKKFVCDRATANYL